jgi:hypothetical protein
MSVRRSIGAGYLTIDASRRATKVTLIASLYPGIGGMVVTLDDTIVHQARDQECWRGGRSKARIRNRPLNDRRLRAANQRLDTRAGQKLLKKQRRAKSHGGMNWINVIF